LVVRPPAVAGLFYPGDPAQLATQLQQLLAAADAVRPARDEVSSPKAYILPHAGYIYSGPYAALGYSEIAQQADDIRHVVLLGPTHRVAVRGLALPGADALATPLGDVPVWADGAAQLAAFPQVGVSAAVHREEHSLEVHLPFLQTVLGDFDVLPLAVGMTLPEEVADVLDAVWGGAETLIVVSSDLSHYLPYQQAQAVDAASLEQIMALGPALGHDQACGASPANGLLVAAARRKLVPRQLGAGNSGDTAGDKSRVVGYCAIAFDENWAGEPG
jgi:AmmeMemoRadiSam system protein B